MQVAPLRTDIPPSIPLNANDKFARVDNNPNIRNAQYSTPFVPAYHGSHHPEFWKSPLTSVQMNRRIKGKPLNLNEAPHGYQAQPVSHRGMFADVDWKKIIFWALIALGILLLLIGLFFLIRALINKGDDSNNLRSYNLPEKSSSKGYTGISPIYVSPIPYSYVEVPTTNAYVEYNDVQSGYGYTTSPEVPTTYADVTTSDSKMVEAAPTTQPTVRWTSDSSESYVNPLNVYNYYHK